MSIDIEGKHFCNTYCNSNCKKLKSNSYLNCKRRQALMILRNNDFNMDYIRHLPMFSLDRSSHSLERILINNILHKDFDYSSLVL